MSEPDPCSRGASSRLVSPTRTTRRSSRRRSRVLASLGFALGSVIPGSAALAQGDAGQVVGVVRDGFNAMALPGAPITVAATNDVVYSELDGAFSLSLPAGRHEIRVSFSGYEEVIVTVEVRAGTTTRVDVALTMERFAEEVVVTGEATEPELFTAEAQLVERQKSATIADNLASEEMKENADSNAASAMKRVTGLTVVDNQYVFVRGLGERYSNTTLNGAVLPTTEPDKRVVPLDLFPTGLIESVSVVKSYLPDKPADFSGGLVEIDPLSFPTEPVMNFSMSQGYNTRTTFEDGLIYPGGGRDWLGFDDGTRSLPSAIPDSKVVRTSRFTSAGFTPAELETMGESFSNVWSPETGQIGQSQSYSFVAGNSWDRLGAIFSATWSQDHQNQREDRRFFAVSQGDLEVQNDYDFDVTTSKTSTGLVGNLAYKFTGNHRIALENFYTHSSKNEARIFEGYNNDVGEEIRNTRLFWVEESIFSSRLSGEHLFVSLGSGKLEWNANLSRATRDEPDLRETLYEYSPSVSAFVLADESQSGFRMFNELDDEVVDLGLDWSSFFTQWSDLPAMIKIGPQVTLRERDFSSRRFRMTPRGGRRTSRWRRSRSSPPRTSARPTSCAKRHARPTPTRPNRRYRRSTDSWTCRSAATSGSSGARAWNGPSSRWTPLIPSRLPPRPLRRRSTTPTCFPDSTWCMRFRSERT